jgi:hypothetical protein
MDITVLFKKRTVNDHRVYLICCALERALQSLSIPVIDAAVSAPEEIRCAEFPQAVPPVSQSDTFQWRVSDSRIASVKKAIVELTALAAQRQQDLAVNQLLCAVMHNFSPEEFIQIVVGEELSVALGKRIRQVVDEIFSVERCQLLAVLLQGPGVHITSVAHMLSSAASSEGAVVELLAVLVARGLGAQPVHYKDAICEGFWTLNVDLVAHLIGEAQKAPKKPSRGQGDNPPVAALDPILLDWIRVQSGLGSSGKRCPRTKRK